MTICSISPREIREWVYQAKTLEEINARIKYLKKDMLPLLVKLKRNADKVYAANSFKITHKLIRQYTDPVLKCWEKRPLTKYRWAEDTRRD